MLLIFAVISCITATVNTCDGGKSTAQRYQEFLQKTGNIFGREKVLRYKIFSRNLKFIEEQNSKQLGYTSNVNKFTVMTNDEIELYHGTNRTLHTAPHNTRPALTSQPPTSYSWIDAGHVTAVKNQDGCGACWTFGPVVAIEGMYKKTTGKLKEFSNQELLDCVYDAHTYNACHGGLETRAFDFVIKRARLGMWREYPYEPVDKRCRSSGKKDGLSAAKVTSYSRNDGSEASTIARLAQGPLSVAFHAILSIHFYEAGIYKSNECGGDANHAVAAVAYTPQYILIKNSWGSEWGDQGLFKFSRNDDACGIHRPENNFLVTMAKTGEEDSDEEDAAMIYQDNVSPTVKPEPTDIVPTTQDKTTTTRDPTVCEDMIESCFSYFCDFYINYKKDCRKTCGHC